MQITFLRCDYMENPVGFDFDRPSLGWVVECDGLNKRQSAYRLQIALDKTFSAPVLDEHKISDASTGIRLEMPLAPRTQYFWRVKVWDETGNESDWSETAFFETGKYSEPWKAEWIRSCEDGDEDCPMLRRTFTIDRPIRKARAYACGVGLYKLYLNGKKVSDEELTPYINAYDHYLQYQTYDVTDMLKEGANAIGGMLGNGYYKGHMVYLGDKPMRGMYGNEFGLIVELVIEYADGEQEIIATDTSWKTAISPLIRSSIYNGEIYDARREYPGWATPEFDDSAWKNAIPSGVEKSLLHARLSMPVRITQERPPVRIIRTPAGEDVVDFGQNCAGWVRIRLDAPAGTEIKIQYGELLDEKGNFFNDNLRAALCEMIYTTREGYQEYEPLFTFFGFSCIRVTGWPGELKPEQFTQCVVHTDLPVTGDFECSNPLVNRLFLNAMWGQRSNFLDIPTDCPQRDERMGWTADSQVFAPTALMNMESAAFYRKYLYDLWLEQKDNDGLVPNVVPNFMQRMYGGENVPTSGWADAATVIPWNVYLFFGDTTILEKQYDSMKAWVDYMRSMDVSGSDMYIPTAFQFGDWLAPDSRDPLGCVGSTPTDLISTVYYAHSTTLVAKAAKILGKEEDERFYSDLAVRIRKAYQREFVSASGRIVSDTQTAPVLSIKMDMLDPAHKPKAMKSLLKRIREDGYYLSTGFLGTPNLCPVLSDNGCNEYSYHLLLNTDCPSWLYPVKLGATTIWERWNSMLADGSIGDRGMNSFNHYAYGAIVEWLYRYVAGINPVESAPGFKKILIRPMVNSLLDHARASIRTQYGMVESAWKLEGDSITIEITIPFNTTAEIHLPDADGIPVEENGKTIFGTSFTRGSGKWTYTYIPTRKTIDKRVVVLNRY